MQIQRTDCNGTFCFRFVAPSIIGFTVIWYFRTLPEYELHSNQESLQSIFDMLKSFHPTEKVKKVKSNPEKLWMSSGDFKKSEHTQLTDMLSNASL